MASIHHREDRTPPSVSTRDDLVSEAVPAEATNLQHVDSSIAKRMSSMSALDREKAYMDVHGIPMNLSQIETPEFIQEKLALLQVETEKLKDKEAYDLALSLDETYVCNKDFLLAFLRADLFDAAKTATRLARHFQLKLKLFGNEKLTMDITQDDLDKETIEALYSGTGRFLPAKDRGGRMINLIIPGVKYSTTAMLRRAFYFFMSAAKDLDFQRKGYTAVGYTLQNRGRGWGGEKDSNYKLSKITETLPVRASAVHLCHDNSYSQENFAMAKAGLTSTAQLRIRMHYGTHDEILSILQGHGIERGVIPVTKDRKITDVDDHRRRMAELRCIERRTQTPRRIIHVPGEHDVLFGKGSPFQNHSGNKTFRSIVISFQERYFSAEKGKKIKIAQEIVDIINQNTGVFLRPEGGVWVVVENNVARNKVSTAFRTLRMDQKKLSGG